MIRHYNTLAPAILATIFGIASTILFFPGIMSFDSLAQYSEAIGETQMISVLAPATTYLWRFLMMFAHTPGVLLVFHNLIYWGALLLFACAVAERAIFRAIIIVLVGLWPPLFIISLHLWKDAEMMSALALAVAALAMHFKRGAFWWLVLAVAALFYATAVRDNAITGVAPLLALLAWRVAAFLSKDIRTKVSAALAVFAVLFVSFPLGVSAVNRHAHKVPQLGTIFLWDMAAVSIDQSKDLIPSYISKTPGPDFVGRMSKNFSPKSNYPVFSEFSPYPPEGKEPQLVADWMKVVLNNFGSYFVHRVRVFSEIMTIDGPIYYPFHPGIDDNKYGIKFAFKNFVANDAVPAFKFFSTLTLYRIWPYFALASLLVVGRIYLVLVHRWKTEFGALVVVTALSGILTELPLSVFATAADYRYSIWMVFSAILAFIMFWVEVVRRTEMSVWRSSVLACIALGAVAACSKPASIKPTESDAGAASQSRDPLPDFPAWSLAYIGKPATEALPQAGACIGNTDDVLTRYVGAKPGTKVEGWAWDPARAKPVSRVLLVDATGKIVGAGETGFARPDVPQAKPSVTSGVTGWHATTELTTGAIDALGIVDAKIGCRLGHLVLR